MGTGEMDVLMFVKCLPSPYFIQNYSCNLCYVVMSVKLPSNFLS